MNKLLLEAQRDFWFSTDALNFMQEAFAGVEKLAGVLGDNYVVSGCTVTGASASPGVIVLNGRIMPFLGGTVSEFVKITETEVIKANGALSRKETTVVAEFGTSTNPVLQVAWASIKKPVETTTTLGIMDSGINTYDLKTITTRIGGAIATTMVEVSNIQVSSASFYTLTPVYTLFPFKLANGLHSGFLRRGYSFYPVVMIVNNNGWEVTIKTAEGVGVLADNDKIVFHNIHA